MHKRKELTYSLESIQKSRRLTVFYAPLRSILRDTTLNKETAKSKLHEWYDKVAASTLREVKAARDTIKLKEDQVLNYFVERSTNASAESFNSKVKNFRALLHGVLDVKFFMYRLCRIFG